MPSRRLGHSTRRDISYSAKPCAYVRQPGSRAPLRQSTLVAVTLLPEPWRTASSTSAVRRDHAARTERVESSPRQPSAGVLVCGGGSLSLSLSLSTSRGAPARHPERKPGRGSVARREASKAKQSKATRQGGTASDALSTSPRSLSKRSQRLPPPWRARTRLPPRAGGGAERARSPAGSGSSGAPVAASRRPARLSPCSASATPVSASVSYTRARAEPELEHAAESVGRACRAISA